jgi:hypothetical protein
VAFHIGREPVDARRPDAKFWSRIDIGGAHLGARWNPFGA